MKASVVIATYRRPGMLRRLLEQLAQQDVSHGTFEVVVVDDGSPEPIAPSFADFNPPYSLTLLRQENAGPAAARHRAIGAATGDIVIVVDDDMSIGSRFVGAHLEAHEREGQIVALGPIRHELPGRGTLMQRFHMESIERALRPVYEGKAEFRGSGMYTGNVSFRRADYYEAGGFDHSFRLLEDSELGLRFELAGARFVICADAVALHDPGVSSLRAWMPFAVANGRAALRIADKHPEVPNANPWRFILAVPALVRPLLFFSALFPRTARALSWPIIYTALGLARVGLERVARAGVALVYGTRFFSGVRDQAGSTRAVLHGHREFLNDCRYDELGLCGRVAKLHADIIADHEVLTREDAKYREVRGSRTVLGDAIRKIGFQIMVMYRIMRFCRASHLTPIAMIMSRLILYIYAADVHYDADLEPGVMIVHGIGLAISGGSVVRRGCVLSHHNSLGVNTHPVTREAGSPYLEEDVYVGPGAVIVGPVRIGAQSKIMANAVVMQSVPRRTVVVTPAPILTPIVAATALANGRSQ